MYVSYPLKMKIGAFMGKNNIKTYSEFLRMATFFLMNNKIGSSKTTVWDKPRTIKSKSVLLADPNHKAHLAVMSELKELFEKGTKILKKVNL